MCEDGEYTKMLVSYIFGLLYVLYLRMHRGYRIVRVFLATTPNSLEIVWVISRAGVVGARRHRRGKFYSCVTCGGDWQETRCWNRLAKKRM